MKFLFVVFLFGVYYFSIDQVISNAINKSDHENGENNSNEREVGVLIISNGKSIKLFTDSFTTFQ